MRGCVHDPATQTERRVQPLWPVRLSDRILDVARDDRCVVIGQPSKKSGWIPSRSPEIDPQVEREIKDRLSEVGYDSSMIGDMRQQALEVRV